MSEIKEPRQSENYIPENDGLTFKQIFSFLGKSLPRITLFVVVAVVISAIICGTIFIGSREKNAQGVIDFAYEGVEKGLDPLGGVFDSESIKAPSVLAAAVKSLNYDVDVTKLRNAITISGVTPKDVMDQIATIKEIATKDPTALQQLDQLKYYPNRYIVTINDCDSLGLSSNEANALLDQIFVQYKSFFKESFGQVSLVSSALKPLDFSTTESEGFVYDYMEICDILGTELNNYINYFTEMETSAKSFRSSTTMLGFGDLKELLIQIRDVDLTGLESFIISKGLAKDMDKTIGVLEQKVANLKIIEARLTSEITAYENLVKKDGFYQQGSVLVPVGDTFVEYKTNSENYDKLVNKLASLYLEKENITSSMAIYQSRIDKLNLIVGGNTPSDIAYANNLIMSINKKIVYSLDVGEETIIEYRTSKLLSDAVYTINSGIVSDSKMSLTMAIGITVVMAIIAATAAMVIENKKQKEKDKVIE